jgi:anti-sigma factor RsiW
VNRRKRDELLSAYIDGEMKASERARLERQLATDSTLRAELAALRRTVALVRGLPPAPLPRNFILSQRVVRRRRASVVARPRWARAAPLLTAASSVVSLLFVIAMAGSFLASATGRAMIAPARELPETDAPDAAVEEVVLEKEAEVVLTAEAEVPAAAQASPEVEAPEEEAAPVEKAAAEEPQTGLATEAVEYAAGEAPEEAEPPAPQPEAEDEGATEAVPAAEAEAEMAKESATPIVGTTTAEMADELRGTETPSDTAGGREVPTSTARLATMTAAPTASMVPETDDAPDADGLEQPSAEPETEKAEVAEEAEAPPPAVDVEPTAAEEHEEPPAEGPAKPTPVEGPEPAGSAPEHEFAAAAPEEEGAELKVAQPPGAVFPWLVIQIAFGSTALLLIGLTVWAWRLRR